MINIIFSDLFFKVLIAFVNRDEEFWRHPREEHVPDPKIEYSKILEEYSYLDIMWALANVAVKLTCVELKRGTFKPDDTNFGGIFHGETNATSKLFPCFCSFLHLNLIIVLVLLCSSVHFCNS